MTAKEKAKYLVYKYYNEMNPNAPDCNISFAQAKQCALIAVNEIISIKLLWFQKDTEHLDFWKEVKEELLKL